MEDGQYIDSARQSLDAIIKAGKRPSTGVAEATVSISEARKSPTFTPQTGRTKTRVLFVTTDLSLLTQATKSLDGFTAVSEMFHEVHIMVLRTGITAKNPVIRVDDNTWLYTVTDTHTWGLPFAAWRMMQQELSFADGFRPDVIVARDCGVSALAVYGAGRYYDRPVQLHIPDTYRPPQKWYTRLFTNWLIGTYDSIRVTTDEGARLLKETHPDTLDVAVLPRFRNYISLFSGQQGTYLKDKYRQFNFIILYIGELTHQSTAFSAIDAVRAVLRNPRVGFVMVGNGTGVMECERRAELLGIKDQVIIERRADDIAKYAESADALIVTDTNSVADEVALYGAAAGVPMVLAKTAMRSDLFADGQSAYLIDDVRSIRTSDVLTRLLNNNSDRMMMRQAVRRVAEQRLYVDPLLYQRTYRASIEAAITVPREEVA
jgi:glycosyltransferase involved in cell wall biosynthesis